MSLTAGSEESGLKEAFCRADPLLMCEWFKKCGTFFRDFGAWIIVLIGLLFLVPEMIEEVSRWFPEQAQTLRTIVQPTEPVVQQSVPPPPPVRKPVQPVKRAAKVQQPKTGAGRLPAKKTAIPVKPLRLPVRAAARLPAQPAVRIRAQPPGRIQTSPAVQPLPLPPSTVYRGAPNSSQPEPAWRARPRAPAQSSSAKYPSLQVPLTHQYSVPSNMPALKSGPPIAPSKKRGGRVQKLDMTPRYR